MCFINRIFWCYLVSLDKCTKDRNVSMSIRKFLGYHGTSLTAAKRIIANGFEIREERDDHWLGQGIYFFNEDIEQAELWALRRYHGRKSAVIKADISIPRDKVLDLHTREGLNYLSGYLEFLEEEKGLKVRQSELDCTPKLACLVLSLIPKEEKWIIFKTFLVTSKYDKNYGLKALGFTHKGIKHGFSLNSPQLCIKNTNVLEENLCICENKGEHDSYRGPKISKESVPDDLFS